MLGSGLVVVVIFALILPKIASYSSVWHTLQRLSSTQVAILLFVCVFNLFTYWWQMMAAMPGLTLAQSAVNNQSSTTIANILPGGGAIAVGVAVAMFRSWGFTASQITLLLSTTGIWNIFMKLGLPIVALGILAIAGQASAPLLVPALVGLAIFAAAVVLFALVLSRREFARSIGERLGGAWSWLRALAHRPAVDEWGERAVRFRDETVALVARRWPALTATTVVSHLALWFVLLASLRAIGVSSAEVSWVDVLAVFAFARLLSAAPITPGGVGVVELALIGGLYAVGRTHATVSVGVLNAQITAAVLLFRALTYGIQIPLGAVTYLIWQHRKRWRRPVSTPDVPPIAEGR
jgi:uncharacterized membrane protein YbhN (UPF0104 family)